MPARIDLRSRRVPEVDCGLGAPRWPRAQARPPSWIRHRGGRSTPVAGPGPKRPLAVDRERRERVSRNTLGVAMVEDRERVTGEARQTLLAGAPQVTVGSLSDRDDEALGQVFARSEVSLSVVRDAAVTIERVRIQATAEMHRHTETDGQRAYQHHPPRNSLLGSASRPVR